jgi:hypothetical protein
MFRALTLAIALAIAGPAFAFGTFGGYQAPQPHWPTTINPNGMGGYTIQRPGNWPTTCNPNGMGGMRCN